MIEPLETVRLSLRPITESDVDLLVELDSDPAVMRFISGGKPSSRDEVGRMVQRSLGHRWVGFDKATEEFVGWFGLRPSYKNVRELGYRLRQSAWGKGLATEGSRVSIAAAFTQLGVERVWAQTMAVNTASRRVMERCGLRFVRTFHTGWGEGEAIEGFELGEVEYELTKIDWERQRASPS
jgi:RimJ/RimL family protein N-acetyltransferase